MKRIFSILLVLATLLSSIAIPVFAEETVISDEGKLPFEDVKADYWFYDAAVFCYANNIINGMDKYTFDFSGKLTRAQFVQMLANLEGVDTSEHKDSPFWDVHSNYWYYGAVCWGYKAGIINGMKEHIFSPSLPLTRAQLAVIMYNYMQEKYPVEISEELLSKYTDRPKESYWYYDAVNYAVSAGLISGVNENTIDPNGQVTRAQAALIFQNFMEKYYYGSCEHSFNEADCANPSVCAECGLVNGLAKGHTLSAYDCVTGGVCTVCEAQVEPSIYIHNFQPATCTEPISCSRCSEIRGKALGHKWKAANCITPKTCTVCKLTEGEPTGWHNWAEATCTKPRTCTGCGITQGRANGHYGGGMKCGRCGEDMYSSYFELLKTEVKGRTYDPETGAYIYTKPYSNNDIRICYYEKEDMLILENIRYLSETEFDIIQVELVEGADIYEYVYLYGTVNGVEFIGTGRLAPATFTMETQEGFGDYAGELKAYYTTYLNVTLRELLMNLYDPLRYMGTYIKDIGFTAFKY